jgi:hypothetical protein
MAIRAKAERQKVEALKEKRDRAEKLTDAERRMISYSTWGTAAGCRCGKPSAAPH